LLHVARTMRNSSVIPLHCLMFYRMLFPWLQEIISMIYESSNATRWFFFFKLMSTPYIDCSLVCNISGMSDVSNVGVVNYALKCIMLQIILQIYLDFILIYTNIWYFILKFLVLREYNIEKPSFPFSTFFSKIFLTFRKIWRVSQNLCPFNIERFICSYIYIYRCIKCICKYLIN